MRNALCRIVVTAVLATGTSWALAQSVSPEQVAEIKEKAAQGDARYQTALGTLHARGIGVPLDYAQSMLWYEKAIAQGYAGAEYELGVTYAEGVGVSQDYSTAKSWFEKAAAQGLPEAQYNLGAIYEEGMGVDPNLETAKDWFKKACDGGLNVGCDAVKNLND